MLARSRGLKRVILQTSAASRCFSVVGENLSIYPNNAYGAGGRSSNSGITVTVFGAYGFVGRYLISELGGCGTRVYVPFRGDELEIRHLKPCFDLGQVGFIPFSVRDKDSIRESINNSDVVVNFIGKHYETKHAIPARRPNGKLSRVNYSFEELHIETARTIAELTKEAGVPRFIHVSALSADVDSPSRWNQSKALGEIAVRKAFPDAVIVKLATVFGPEDRFLNYIGELTSRLPFFPLIQDGTNLLQPVYVHDVAKGIMNIINDYGAFQGRDFQFYGPAEYSYKELAEFVQDVTLQRKPLIEVPLALAKLTGKIIQQLPNPAFTADYIPQLLEDVVKKEDKNLLTLESLNIEAQSLDVLAFDYLHRFRPGGHFTLVKGYH